MNTTNFKCDQIINYNGEAWKVIGVGSLHEEKGRYLHIASTTRGKMQKNGWYPVQACVWSILNEVSE